MSDAYYCPEGDGGNSTITNQDEAMILAQTIGSMPIRGVDVYTEDDSHLQGQYKIMASDVAGS
jgi:hypothetical protein